MLGKNTKNGSFTTKLGYQMMAENEGEGEVQK
jgi:hypothetical protein